MRRFLLIVFLLCSLLTFGRADSDSLVFTLEIDDNPLDWCSLNMSSPMMINRGAGFMAEALIYEPELTDPEGVAKVLSAYIGYSTVDNNPAGNNWTWIKADYQRDFSNGDNYWLDIGAVLVETGVYYLASRVTMPDGVVSYGGIDGFWDGTTYPSMELTVVDTTLAIAEEALPTKFTVYSPYPNPFNGQVNLKIDLPGDDRVELKIFNLRGEMVYESNQNYRAGSPLVTLDFNTRPTGMYVAVIRSKYGVFREKLLLIK